MASYSSILLFRTWRWVAVSVGKSMLNMVKVSFLLCVCILLSACSPDDEIKPIQTIMLPDTTDTFGGNGIDDGYVYVVSRHELYFSRSGFVAYKTEEPSDHYTLYVYKWPPDKVDTTIFGFVATNQTMFAEKMRKMEVQAPYEKIGGKRED